MPANRIGIRILRRRRMNRVGYIPPEHQEVTRG